MKYSDRWIRTKMVNSRKREVKGPLEEGSAKIDTDEDGFLSKEEVEKAPKPERAERRPQSKK